MREKKEMSYLNEKYDIRFLKREEIPKFTEHVFEVYKQKGWVQGVDEYEEMLIEDLRVYDESTFVAFFIKGTDKIVASCRISNLSRANIKFPIEEDFGINVRKLLKGSTIFHSGRLAINKKMCNKKDSVKILSTLIFIIFREIQENDGHYLVGEADELVLRMYRVFMKLKVHELGEGVDYLGSLTYPVAIDRDCIDKYVQGF